MGIKEQTVGRSDMFIVPVASITVEPGFNLRESIGDVTALAASMKAVGFLKEKPLLVEVKKDDSIVVRDGHRRLAAAIEAGVENVPVVVDRAACADPIAIIARMLSSNAEAMPLFPWEEGAGFVRMSELGATQEDIAKAVGRTGAYVSMRITTTHATKAQKDAFRKGAMSVHELVQSCRPVQKAIKSGDDEAAKDAAREASEAARAKADEEKARKENAEKNRAKQPSEPAHVAPSEPAQRARAMKLSDIEAAIDEADKREMEAAKNRSKREEQYWHGVGDGLRIAANLETFDSLMEAFNAE